MTNIEILLQQVANILDMRNKVANARSDKFNIFTVLDMETKEVNTHCRLIYELLSPDGQHGMGRAFLDEFFDMVLHKPAPEFVMIKREYAINALADDEYGRIDLLLEGKGFCYPIEVKIYADDQSRQIERYNNFALKEKNNQVYYLTLDGHEPSTNSLGNLEENAVECLSFATDIRGWLIRCGEIAWWSPAVSEIIRQYISLIDKLTGNVQEDEYMSMIKNMVGVSKENYQSAFAIEHALKLVRTEMMQRVFSEIENHIGDRLSLFRPQRNYVDLSKKYYESNRRVWPGLSYLLNTCGDYNIALRFEVEENFYYGVVFFKNDWDQVPKEADKILNAFSNEDWRKTVKSYKRNDWWLWYKYLPSKEKRINFRNGNENYSDLYDSEGYSKIMQEVFMEIDTQLESIRNTGLCR